MNFKYFELSLIKNILQSNTIDLSNYQLQLDDYEQLFDLIKDSLYLEELILPKIQEKELDKIFELLDNATKKNITLKKISMKILPNSMRNTKQSNPYWEQINSRLSRNREKIFGIHGGGNIGLCLMANVASSSPEGFNIVATSSDELVRNVINSTNQLHFQHKTNKDISTVSNCIMIKREKEQVIQLYQEAVLIAICVTADVMQGVAEEVAMGLMQRYEKDGSFLKILVLMNKPNSVEFTYESVFKAMMQLTNDDSEYVEKVLAIVEFVPTVIDRIVTKLPEEEIKKQIRDYLLKSNGMEESEVSTDFQEFDKQVDAILSSPQDLKKLIFTTGLKINLFKAEKKFSFYVSKEFKEHIHFPLIKTTDNLKLLEDIKNKCINGTHAIIAWMGALEGATTIAEAMEKPHLEKFINELLEEEIKPIILTEYPSLASEELNSICYEFLERCKESNDDLVIRVGRDPLRKLNSGGRIRGLIEISQKNFMPIKFEKIEYGIAAGLMYALKDIDPENRSCVKIKEIFSENSCDYGALLCYSGEAPCEDFIGFDAVKDEKIIKNIIEKMQILNEQFEKQRFMEKNDKKELIEKLKLLGVNVEKETGHLFYEPYFTPLKLEYDLVFIRHGETYGNCGQVNSEGNINFNLVKAGIKDHEKRIFQGNVDEDANQLTKTGRAQSHLLVKKIEEMLIDKNWNPEFVLLSPLKRAKETSYPFVAKYNLQSLSKTVAEIREMSFGQWDNRRICDLADEDECHFFYKNQNSLVKKSGTNGSGSFQEAESFCEVLIRARNILLKLNDIYKCKRIVMFSHSMFGAACCILLGKAQLFENSSYIAFDGKRTDGSYYTMPNATPFLMNFDLK
jgi:mannitol-1-phosphate/altronate dehydrogenase/broad specificity phosphatase PhoE